jgi:hypothetical protein
MSFHSSILSFSMETGGATILLCWKEWRKWCSSYLLRLCNIVLIFYHDGPNFFPSSSINRNFVAKISQNFAKFCAFCDTKFCEIKKFSKIRNKLICEISFCKISSTTLTVGFMRKFRGISHSSYSRQCCGSGMFIPDPYPTIFWYPVSRIQIRSSFIQDFGSGSYK